MRRVTAVYVCKECKGGKPLAKLLRACPGAKLQSVGCQKVCKGPVAGLAVGDRMEWFGRLDKKKRVRALVDLLAGATAGKQASVPEILEPHRMAKRSGRPPR